MNENEKNIFYLVLCKKTKKAGIVHSSMCYDKNNKELKFKQSGKENEARLIKSGRLVDLIANGSIDINFVINPEKQESEKFIQQNSEKVSDDSYLRPFVSTIKINIILNIYYFQNDV
jgi:hypothetical protein